MIWRHDRRERAALRRGALIWGQVRPLHEIADCNFEPANRLRLV
jgi:hypothetical protein